MTRIVRVEHCGVCPFSYDPDDGGVWTCTAAEDDNGNFREMRPRIRKGVGWTAPPKWCPLRKEVHVVELGKAG